MEKTINIKGVDYLVTDEETMSQTDELVFEVRNRYEVDNIYIIGMWDDLLGSPIRKVWKIINKTKI